MSPEQRAFVELEVSKLLEDLPAEEQLVILGAVKGRVQARILTSHLPAMSRRETKLLTAKEAARRLSVSPKTVYAKQDQLGVVSVGSRGLRFPDVEVEKAMRKGLT